jgi:hypothetical protein
MRGEKANDSRFAGWGLCSFDWPVCAAVRGTPARGGSEAALASKATAWMLVKRTYSSVLPSCCRIFITCEEGGLHPGDVARGESAMRSEGCPGLKRYGRGIGNQNAMGVGGTNR